MKLYFMASQRALIAITQIGVGIYTIQLLSWQSKGKTLKIDLHTSANNQIYLIVGLSLWNDC